MNKTDKITKATFKSFLRKNAGKLYVRVKSSFDGMTDCVQSVNGGFEPAKMITDEKYLAENNQGIAGVWLVGSGRDYFQPYKDETFTGIYCSNCCGSFVVAVKIEQEAPAKEPEPLRAIDGRPVLEDPPKDDLAGLRNQIRLAYYAVERGDNQEVMLQLVALLDDLTYGNAAFSWRSAPDREKDDENQANGVAAYCMENPAMVD